MPRRLMHSWYQVLILGYQILFSKYMWIIIDKMCLQNKCVGPAKKVICLQVIGLLTVVFKAQLVKRRI